MISKKICIDDTDTFIEKKLLSLSIYLVITILIVI